MGRLQVFEPFRQSSQYQESTEQGLPISCKLTSIMGESLSTKRAWKRSDVYLFHPTHSGMGLRLKQGIIEAPDILTTP